MGGMKSKKKVEEELWGSPPAKPRSKSMARADARLADFAEKAAFGRTYTLQEIAKVMGVTRERVRQIEARALKKLYRRLGQVFRNENITPTEAVDVVRRVSDGGLEHGVVEKEDA